jgi:hypothetical protein
MLAVYADHFNDQLAGLERDPGPPGFVARQVPEYWRPDARVFLIANLMHMVVNPILSVPGPIADGLLPLLAEDIAAIRALSEAIASQRGRDYVSATSVAIALGQLAPDLATTALQVWGPEEPNPAPQTQTA